MLVDQGRKLSEARKPLDGYPAGRPFEGIWLTRRIAPFVGVAMAAFLAILLLMPGTDEGEVLIAASLIPPLVVSARATPWERLPAWVQAVPPLLYFAIVALMRDASSADTSTFAILVILPVFWFALYGTAAQLAASLVGLLMTLALPALIAGGPRYPPQDELVRAILWLVVAGGIGLAVHRLVAAVRNFAGEYRSTVETAHESFISMDAAGRVVEWNRQAERDFGWTRDEVIGAELAELVVPARNRRAHREGLGRFLETGDGDLLGRRIEMEALHRDGHEFPVELTISAMPVKDGYRFNAFLHDVSSRRRNERALREAEERFRRAFDDAAIGMAIVSPEGRWLQVNQALADLTGYPKYELTGMAFTEITHPDDLGADLEALEELVSGTRPRFVTEKRYYHADGRVVWISLNVSVVRDADGEVLYLISQMQDITERKEAEAKLTHQAMHDPLTGLPNRILFSDRMVLAKARMLRGGSVGLLFCDLDYFKAVNDGLGHDAGDRLLIDVGARLRAVLRPSDTVARFGGDEFAILCEGVDLEAAVAIADRVAETFSSPFRIDGREVMLSASTGIVLSRDPDFDPDELFADADVAMYTAKRGGRGRQVVFRAEMHEPRRGGLHLSPPALERTEPDAS